MRISFVCLQCAQKIEKNPEKWCSLELSDSNLYKVTCEDGHVTNIALQQHKFEMLFDIGMYALLDGYPDAAVSRFSVALERFYEFCICVFLYAQELDFKAIKVFLKSISNYSEREAGAFLMFYNIEKFKYPEKNFLQSLNNNDKKVRYFCGIYKKSILRPLIEQSCIHVMK